jgi:hypothetical protein
MARKTVEVSQNDVRQWASEQDDYKGAKFLAPREGEAFARGRVPNAVIEAYTKANPGHVVVTGRKSGAVRTLDVTLTDKRGRNYTRKVEVTNERIRELAGELAPKRGTFSKAVIEAAASALAAEMQSAK